MIENKFQVGNCVGLERTMMVLSAESREWVEYFGSWHILTEKEIKRGFYWARANTMGVLTRLEGCCHKLPYNNCYRGRDQSLKGKVTQPVSDYVFDEILWESVAHDNVVCYIMFKGQSHKVGGLLNKQRTCMYFVGMNSRGYKTKVFVDEDGYLRGVTKGPLSERQKRNSTRFGQ